VKTHNRTTHKTKKDEQDRPHQTLGVNSGAREGQAVPASYKTPINRRLVMAVFIPAQYLRQTWD